MSKDQLQSGRVFQVNISPGGVPKLPIRHAYLNSLGLVGDDHRSQSHGGPQRALCLYSLERLQALQAEGHPIFAGAIGENLTLSGLDWDQIVPGVSLQIGKDVVIEVTNYTTPCSNLTESFIEGKFARVLQEKNPGWSRVYTRVLQEGEVWVGAPVFVKAPAG